MRNIHSTAIIEEGAVIGEDVSVGPFSFIQSGAKIGDGCVIDSNVVIFKYATIGKNVRIHPCAVIADEPQDYGFDGAESYVKIGDNCIIREGVTIHRGSKAGTCTEVGEGCLLMANSHVAHNVRLGPRVIMANGALLSGYVEVGERAFLSGNCGVHQFCRIGKLAMVTACTVITKDVPPFCITRHAESNVVAGLNVIGMRRAGMELTERSNIKRAFKMLYCSGMQVSEAVKKMEEVFLDGAAVEFINFIKASKRGICRYEGRGSTIDSEED
mgnify:CR=1 FL=1